MAQTVKVRTGGRLVAECLEAAGAEVAFGVPGIHALAIWDGLRTSPVRAIGLRTELSAGFAADGYARTSGKPAPLLLSTGPGALISLAALMEAASAHVPVVAIASQIPRELIGAGRGFLHELADQKASFEPVVKWAARAETASEIPELVAEAWRRALTPPSGPVFLEIPVDVLAGETDAPVGDLDTAPVLPPLPPESDIVAAGRVLAGAERPVIWAGGGVLRSGAWEELRAVAERLGAPVVSTYMGKGAFPEDHPLAAGTASDEPAVQELLGQADAILAVGTELGAETTGHYSLELSRPARPRRRRPESGSAQRTTRWGSSVTREASSRRCSRACRRPRARPARSGSPTFAGGSRSGWTARNAGSSAGSCAPSARRSRATPSAPGT